MEGAPTYPAYSPGSKEERAKVAASSATGLRLDRPSVMAAQSGACPMPAGETMPIPVTTMRLPPIPDASLEQVEEIPPHHRGRDQRTEQFSLALGTHFVHQLEGRPSRRRLRAQDRTGELPRLAHHPVGSDAAVHESNAMRLPRTHRLAGQDHLQGLRPPHEPRQPARAGESGDEAERQLGEPEAGARSAHTDVAAESDLEPAAEAEPIHGCDEGLREAEEIVEQRPPDLGLADRLLLGRRGEERDRA